jgi:lysine-specific demethylase 3
MVPFTYFQEGELEALVKDVNDVIPKESAKTEDQGEKFQRGQSEGFLPFIKTSVKDIKEEDFDELWGLGRPIVLTDCLKRFKVSWTPAHFIKKYRTVKCLLVNCLSDKTLQSTVGKFFQEFLSPDTKQPLKLKVPPPLHHAYC